MRLKGSAPGGLPALSYVGSPTGSIVGSTQLPMSNILSVRGEPGPPGLDGEAAPHTHPITEVDGLETALATKQTASQVQALIDTSTAALVDSAPATLDTLNELAAALGDDPNFATTTATAIGLRAPIASPTFTGTATTPALKVTGGSPATNKVLTSDSTGNATWASLPDASSSAKGLVQLAGDLAGVGSSAGSPRITDSVRDSIARMPAGYEWWHDILAFGKKNGFPTQESRTSGVWSTVTAEKGLYSHQEGNGYVLLADSSAADAVRMTWNSAQFAYCNVQHFAIGFGYANPRTIDTTIERSTDGVAWETVGTDQNTSSANTRIIGVPTWGAYQWMRITFVRSSGTGELDLTNIQALTNRKGDQGGSRELGFPYVWDKDRRLGLGTNSLPTTGQVRIGDDTTTNSGGLVFGTDTYLHRGGVGMLSTPGNITLNRLYINQATPVGATEAVRKDYVDAQVAGIVDSAPTTLNTLNELAAALGDDPNFATTTAALIGTKVTAYTGQTPTLWFGTQAEYDALSSGTKNAAGFVAVIRP